MIEQNNADKEIWEAKDRLHAYQTALNVAGINNTGLGKLAEDIIAEANKYYEELIKAKNGANQTIFPKPDITPTAEQIPIPTLEQKNIFEELARQTNVDYTLVVAEIWKKKHSLVIENIVAAKKYLLGLKNDKKI